MAKKKKEVITTSLGEIPSGFLKASEGSTIPKIESQSEIFPTELEPSESIPVHKIPGKLRKFS